MSGVLQGKCCATCRNISQKTPMKEFTEKNSLTSRNITSAAGSYK